MSVTDAPTGPTSAATKIRELFEQYRLPDIDLEAFIAARQSDIEAISKATAAAYAGAQTIADRQADLLKAALGELKDALPAAPTGATVAATIEAAAEKQREIVAATLTRTLGSMKEMAEAGQRAQTEVYNLAVERVHANAEELRSLFAGQKQH